MVPFIEIQVVADIPLISDSAIFFQNNNNHPEEIVLYESSTIEQNNAGTILLLPAEQIEKVFPIEIILIILYLLGCILLFIRFCVNIFSLLLSVKNKEVLDYHGAKLVLIEEQLVAHSFFNYIFVSKHDYDNKEIKHEIFLHELTHVRQKHSFDIVFVELLSVFLWFNPVIYIYTNKIKLNHEFLADENVVENCEDISFYQQILLNESNRNSKLSLASNFNYLITKKRLVMMTKISSTKVKMLKISGVIGVLAVSVLIFSMKVNAGTTSPKLEPYSENNSASIGMMIDTVYPEDRIVSEGGPFVSRGGDGATEEKMNEFKALKKKYQDKDGKWDWGKMEQKDKDTAYSILKSMSLEQKESVDYSTIIQYGPPRKRGKGASQEQINEFQNILKKYETWDGKYKNIEIADQDKLKSIYDLMTSQQQDSQKILIEGPYPTFPKVVPTAKELQSWKNSKIYGVWIDGKKIDNAELEKYKHTDFSLVFISRLMPNAKNAKDYKFQVDLMTNKGYKEYLEKKKSEKPSIFYREGNKRIKIG